ncbi:MAG: helix-turn-helix transcriptional regulator [Desulfobacteraceae bacterium]|jgi:transcriptional regulator with XRE-family HTH domain|nr:helix-turn-helix transcriptional regulator [Desulfobacteraceae bacterium]
MRIFENIIREIINDSGLKLNTISKTSGISHTYLTKLINDNINRPGKDKIASIMLALNHSIEEINTVLAGYDYQALDEPDIPGILENNRKRKIEGNTLSLYDDIHVKLLLSPMERMGGTKILVKKAPSVLFMPDELYLGRKTDTDDNDPPDKSFYHAFTSALFKERKAIFQMSCNAGARFETYICRHCLEAYVKNVMDANQGGQPELVLRFFANAAAAIRANPDQHRTWIMERCPWFDYMIQGDDHDDPKVFFFGKKSHDYGSTCEQANLQGFSSDSPAMIDLFRKETRLCRSAIDPQLKKNYPDNLIGFFIGLFRSYGFAEAFTAYMDRSEPSDGAVVTGIDRPRSN